MLDWKGGQVQTNVEGASRKAIDETMVDAVKIAKGEAPVKTSAYHGSIQMRPAVRSGSGFSGFWGSFTILYAIFIELGTKAHIIKPKTAGALFWPGAAHPVKEVKHPGTEAQHILTGAADETYPQLAAKIRKHL